MDPVGVHGEGDVDPVVDEQLCAIAGGKLAQVVGGCVQVTAGEVLLPELDRLHSTLEGLFDDKRDLPAAGVFPVGNQVEVEIDRRSGHSIIPSRGLDAVA